MDPGSHADEERQRVDSEREQCPTEDTEPDNIEKNADDDHGDGSRDKGCKGRADGNALRPHLKSVYLESKTILFNPGDVIDKVWFPEGAIVSLVVSLTTGEMVEGAMVGKDGVVGVG
jgi:hypothetical protein